MLTNKGFKRKRYIDFFEEMSEQARMLYGENVHLTERSPLGKFVSLIAYARALDAENAENVYNSRFVDTSGGIPLQQNVKRALITKNEWKKSTGIVELNLLSGVVIPAGDLVGTNYGVNFEILTEVESHEAGVYAAQIRAVEFGRIGNALAGSIEKIINPTIGFLSVTNPEPLRNGQDEETDRELQDRYYESLGKSGNRRTESIRAQVLDEVEGVRACIVDENDTMVISDSGVPPKAFETIVLGGDAPDIARKIFEAKPDGIQAYGSTVLQVEDSTGKSRSIGFTYAEELQVYVKALIKKGSNYPLDGDAQVKEQIVKFIGGAGNNETHNGLGMNADVVVARVEAQLFRVEGVEDVRVSLSLDGQAFEEVNIPITFKKVAETNYSKIEVSDLVA